jgi:hypothetical protein
MYNLYLCINMYSQGSQATHRISGLEVYKAYAILISQSSQSTANNVLPTNAEVLGASTSCMLEVPSVHYRVLIALASQHTPLHIEALFTSPQVIDSTSPVEEGWGHAVVVQAKLSVCSPGKKGGACRSLPPC